MNDAFMRAIIATPDDDGPRLVYADWLEESGESEYSEFIRVQCQLADHPKHTRQKLDVRFAAANGNC